MNKAVKYYKSLMMMKSKVSPQRMLEIEMNGLENDDHEGHQAWEDLGKLMKDEVALRICRGQFELIDPRFLAQVLTFQWGIYRAPEILDSFIQLKSGQPIDTDLYGTIYPKIKSLMEQSKASMDVPWYPEYSFGLIKETLLTRLLNKYHGSEKPYIAIKELFIIMELHRTKNYLHNWGNAVNRYHSTNTLLRTRGWDMYSSPIWNIATTEFVKYR